MVDAKSKLIHIHYNIDGLYQLFGTENVNSHAIRCIGRRIFILLDSYFKIISFYKNNLFKYGVLKKDKKKELEALIKKARIDWDNQYDVIRDKLSAHSQDFGGADLFIWWNEIDYTTITCFCDSINDIRGVLTDSGCLTTLTPTDYEMIDFSNSRFQELADNIFLISNDRLAFAKKNCSGIAPQNLFQERCTALSSLIDFLEIEFSLSILVDSPNTYYKSILFESAWALACCDMCSILSALYDGDAYTNSILNLSDSSWKGLQIVKDGNSRRDKSFEKDLYDIRNKFCAHIDSALTMRDLSSMFASFDISRLHLYAVEHVNVFRLACHSDIRTVGFRDINCKLSNDIIALDSSMHADHLK